MRKQKKKKIQFQRVLAALVFLVALALLLSTVGATLAKYVNQAAKNGAAAAVPFYFVSDRLKEDPPYYQISEPAEGEAVTVTFSLSNFVDELRCTEHPLQYTCWAENAASEVISGTERSGSLSGDFQTETITLTLEKSAFGGDGVVTVAAQSTEPYVKTVSARFGFTARQGELQWTVEEQEGAVVLELAGGGGSAVTVAWPASLLPEPMNALLSGAASGEITFTPQPGTRYALTFLKKNPKISYVKEDFTVTEQESMS